MKVCIVHDSLKGNGKILAEKLATDLRAKGAEVVLGHRNELTPAEIAADPPDLLIVGAAVRAFITSPPIKQWISRVSGKLKSNGSNIPYSAVFLTHVMPDPMVEGRITRLKRSLEGAGSFGQIYEEWLSGQVKDIPGPFVDGVMDKAAAFAENLFNWVQPGA